MSFASLLAFSLPASAQVMPEALPGPAPTHADLAYAEVTPENGQGHLLDLYLPEGQSNPAPVVIFTHGSGWMRDNGREDAQGLAEVLLPRGYAVAGVSVRSSAQAQFPGQLHDIKAAIRWLRAHADEYGLDADHVGIVGDSSGGWTAAMAAVTSDAPETEGQEGTRDGSGAVQAAVAFYPPVDLPKMDDWALRPCDPSVQPFDEGFCHMVSGSPETRFLGCIATVCTEQARLASPLSYVSAGDAPLMIVHGENDQMVPHAQGEALYQAMNKACREVQFLSLPLAQHGGWNRMMSDPDLAYGATLRSTSAEGCETTPPEAVTPSWDMLVSFLDRHLKP